MSTSPAITISESTWKAWQKVQRETLKNFTDASTEYVAKVISDFKREAAREQELHQAKFDAGMTKLEYRIEAVADLERRLAERLATLNDGPSIDIDAVRPVVREYVEQILAGWDRPKDGTSVTIADVHPILVQLVTEAVAKSRQEQPEAREVRHWSPRPTGWPLPIIDVEPDDDSTVDSSSSPLRIEQITAAVRLLPQRAP